MSDYALATLHPEFYELGGEKYGMAFECPNCGAFGGVYFANSIPSGKTIRPSGPNWQRTGETFETLTLTPSVAMQGHFHSWVRNGMLCVDSPFSCVKA